MGGRFLTVTGGFWLMLAVIYYLDGEILAASLLAAVFHEGGHWLFIRLLGGRVESLRLSAVGAELRLGQPHLSYRREVPVALAGPAASLLAAAVAARCGWYLFAGLSLALGCFNLLPAGQLDGGRALLGGLSLFMPMERAGRVAQLVSVVTVGCILGCALGVLRVFGNVTLLCTALWLLFTLGYRQK